MYQVRIKEEQELIDADACGTPLMTREQRQWQSAVVTAHGHMVRRGGLTQLHCVCMVALYALFSPRRCALQVRGKSGEPPDAPEGAMREWLHGIVTSASFNALVTLVVLFNTIVMALKYYGIEDDPPMYKPCTRPPSMRPHASPNGMHPPHPTALGVPHGRYELYTTLMSSCVHVYYAEAALKIYGLGCAYPRSSPRQTASATANRVFAPTPTSPTSH